MTIDPAWPHRDGEMAGRIRGHDWAATPLGPLEGWSERLRLMVEQVLASPLVASLVCGSERVLVYNDAAARLYGARHPAALGRPLPEAFPEGWATVEPYYARAFAGETVQVAGQPLDTRGEGTATDVFDALLSPVREADGRVALVHMTGSEIGARLRDEAALRASEAQYRDLFDAIDEGFCLIEVLFDRAGGAVDYRFLMVNAAFAEQTGLADAVGRRIKELVPGHEAHWFEAYGRIAVTGRPERFEDRAEALGRWYDVFAFRVGAPEQRQVGVLFKDVMARRRADAALRESEARFRAFVTASSDVVYRMSPDWRQMRRLDGRHFLADTRAPREDWAEAYILPEDRPAVFAAVAAAIRDKRLFELRHRVRRADGSVGWTFSRAVPILTEDGGIAEWLGTASDVTAHEEAEASMRDSEAQRRVALDGGRMGTWRWDLRSGLVRGDARFLALWGLPPSDASHPLSLFTERMSPEGRAEMEVVVTRAIAAGEEFDGQLEVVAGPTAGHWVRWRGRADRSAPSTLYGVTFDVTEQRQAEAAIRASEERQQVMVAELQHRTRNLLAVVDGIARQTLEHTGPGERFVAEFGDRLVALSRVQGLLSRSDAKRVTIGDIVRLELDALGADLASDRIRLAGPEVGLRNRVVQTIALAMHELATNARKYGALANDRGRLGVRWETTEADGRPWLSLEWLEEGLDRAREERSPVTRGGYGRELIEEALPYALGARTTYRLDGERVRCTIALPLDEVGKEAEA